MGWGRIKRCDGRGRSHGWAWQEPRPSFASRPTGPAAHRSAPQPPPAAPVPAAPWSRQGSAAHTLAPNPAAAASCRGWRWRRCRWARRRPRPRPRQRAGSWRRPPCCAWAGGRSRHQLQSAGRRRVECTAARLCNHERWACKGGCASPAARPHLAACPAAAGPQESSPARPACGRDGGG